MKSDDKWQSSPVAKHLRYIHSRQIILNVFYFSTENPGLKKILYSNTSFLVSEVGQFYTASFFTVHSFFFWSY
jgi:hypothetical protein